MEEDKDDFSLWYQKVLKEAQLVDDRYPIKGMTVYRGNGMRILRRIQFYLENLLEEDGHEPVQFPVLIDEDSLAKEGEHIAGFEEQVFWVTHAGKTPLERRLALRPTSETSMYNIFPLWIRSHTDLPVKIHQSCFVYRYETKHTRPLIRGREFFWNEGHTAFETALDAQQNIKTIKEIYGRLINELCCLPYQVNKRPDWDKFPGAEYTIAFETLMPGGRTLQLATAHDLGQNFSKVFDITFETVDGSHAHAFQTSYGPGFGRLLAAVMGVHGDEKGLVLPPHLAPTQAVVIPIVFKGEGKDVLEYARKVEKALKAAGVRAAFDDSDARPGAKYFLWEMRGVPVRVEAGPRDMADESIMLVRRDTGEKKKIKVSEAASEVTALLEEIQNSLRERAQKKFDENQYVAKDLKQLSQNLGKGIVSTGWCGESECAKPIDELGTILTVVDEEKHDCVVCGNPGRKIRVAKTY